MPFQRGRLLRPAVDLVRAGQLVGVLAARDQPRPDDRAVVVDRPDPLPGTVVDQSSPGARAVRQGRGVGPRGGDGRQRVPEEVDGTGGGRRGAHDEGLLVGPDAEGERGLAPTTPSTNSSRSAWTTSTAAAVAASKVPDAGPVRYPAAINDCCTQTTLSPDAPAATESTSSVHPSTENVRRRRGRSGLRPPATTWRRRAPPWSPSRWSRPSTPTRRRTTARRPWPRPRARGPPGRRRPAELAPSGAIGRIVGGCRRSIAPMEASTRNAKRSRPPADAPNLPCRHRRVTASIPRSHEFTPESGGQSSVTPFGARWFMKPNM